ncbi:MAG: hypothetical protein LN573_05045 [Rickettsia endosymbiont of Oxypoda opaca]|nr:hypothetical protein [Rickettsia endosymbiont of Oxypoda opaca]
MKQNNYNNKSLNVLPNDKNLFTILEVSINNKLLNILPNSKNLFTIYRSKY